MIHRSIGQTELTVSPIGLGTVKLGRNQGVKYPTSFAIPNDQQVTTLLIKAKELGINLIDTAPAYGNSEERLGKLLKGQRQDWVICTKTGEEFINGQSQFNFSPEHTRYSVERSLQRLQTDFLDIVLVHSNGNDTDIIQTSGIFECLAELKQQGLLRTFGMSTKTIEGGLLAVEKSDLVMATYNLQHQEEKPVIELAAKKNKGIFIKKAFSSGHIPQSSPNDTITETFNCIFSKPSVTSIILGTININHLVENVKKAKLALTC